MMSSSLMGTAPIHDDVIAIYCVIIAKCEYSHLQSCNPFMMTKRNLLCRRHDRLVRKSPNCHKQLNFHSFLFHMAIFFLFHNIRHLFLVSDQVLVPMTPPRPVSSLHLELRHLMDTFSRNAQVCGPYPEGFFDALPRKQREYLVRVSVRLVLPVNLCEICVLSNQGLETRKYSSRMRIVRLPTVVTRSEKV